MSSELPPRPSKRATIALAVVALVTFLYSVVIAAQILLWFVLVGLAVGLYLTYLLIVAIFRLVEAVERIATAAEVDSGIRTAAEAGDPTPPVDGDDAASESGTSSVETDADSVVPDEDGAVPDDVSPDESAESDESVDPDESDTSDDPDESGDRPNDG